MECIYCKKTNHTSKRCFFKKLHKQPEQLEKQQRSEIKIWRTTQGKNIKKCYNKGQLILNTKRNLETPTITQSEPKVKKETKVRQLIRKMVREILNRRK